MKFLGLTFRWVLSTHFIVLGAICFVGGIFLVVVALRSKSWPNTDGTIVTAKVVGHKGKGVSYPPRIASSERIVTLEQWGGRMNEAIVWAVRPAELVIYRIFSSTADELLATVPLKKEESDAIRELVSKIGKSERGKVWFDANISDGSAIRISFSADGDLRDDRIEVENHWRSEFQALIERISEKAPEKWKVRFKERIAHREKGHRADIRCATVKEYHGRK